MHADQKSKALAFRAMHRGPKILVLPNAWDVASARVFEEAGFGAIRKGGQSARDQRISNRVTEIVPRRRPARHARSLGPGRWG